MTLPFATLEKANLIKKLISRHFAHFSILESILLHTIIKKAPYFQMCHFTSVCIAKESSSSSTCRCVFVYASWDPLTSKRCFEMRLTVNSYSLGLWFRAAWIKFYGGMLVIFSLLSSSFSRAPPQPKLLLLLRVVCGYLPCVEDQKVCEPLLLVKIIRKWQNMWLIHHRPYLSLRYCELCRYLTKWKSDNF